MRKTLEFKQKNKIHRSLEFDRIYKNGKRVNQEVARLVFTDSKEIRSRIGIVISKKIRGSVKRNRIKRLFREAFRLNQNNIRSNNDMILLVTGDFNPKTLKKAQNMMISALNKAKILKNE